MIYEIEKNQENMSKTSGRCTTKQQKTVEKKHEQRKRLMVDANEKRSRNK